MTLNILLQLNREERKKRWISTIEGVYSFFEEYPSYGGWIHSGFSDLFAAIGLFDSDLIFLVNQTLVPFVHGNTELKPKNRMWKLYTASEDGKEREKAYLSAHNMDLESVINTDEIREIERRSPKREKAFYRGLIYAARIAEKAFYDDSDTSAAEAYTEGAESFVKTFLEYDTPSLTADDLRLLMGTLDIDPLEVFTDKTDSMGRREIWAARAVHTLKKVSPLLGNYLVEEIKELCGYDSFIESSEKEGQYHDIRSLISNGIVLLSKFTSRLPYF